MNPDGAGFSTEIQLRVPYAHVDQMGVVYYAHYFVYFEMGRSDLLRAAGLPYPELERRGVMLPVVEANCRYRKPAYYDDLLSVRSSVVAVDGPRIRISYEIRRLACGTAGRGGLNDLLATGHTQHAFLSREGRVLKPLPELIALAQR